MYIVMMRTHDDDGGERVVKTDASSYQEIERKVNELNGLEDRTGWNRWTIQVACTEEIAYQVLTFDGATLAQDAQDAFLLDDLIAHAQPSDTKALRQ